MYVLYAKERKLTGMVIHAYIVARRKRTGWIKCMEIALAVILEKMILKIKSLNISQTDLFKET
jgi:hypothetical protein